MKALRILSIRKNTDAHVAALEAEYLKRLRPHFAVSLIDIRQTYSEGKTKPIPQIVSAEADLFEKKLETSDIDEQGFAVLDPAGKELSSEEFTVWLKDKSATAKNLAFLIGGAYGLDPKIKRRAGLVLSLSRMTFTHEFARLILLEQIYRGVNILSGGSYHK